MAEQFQQIRLFTDPAQPAATAGPAVPAPVVGCGHARALWLCLYFPELVSAAETGAADQQASALNALADAALDFTPAVSPEAPAALLLEIAGSLRLFGPPAELREQVLAACHGRGYQPRAAVAPTSRAALWLARGGCDTLIDEPAGLAGGLAALPVDALPWPVAIRRTLREMGIRRLGECARLPRGGLARRLGPDYLRELDQAYGRMPEARSWHRAAASFAERLDMPAETADRQLLSAAADRLLDSLQDSLRRRQCSLGLLWLRLEHTGAPATLLRIGLLRETSDVLRLKSLMRIHLEAVALPEKVVGLAMEAGLREGGCAATAPLFENGGPSSAGFAGLLERLRARLGNEAVYGIRALREHRPEYAWQAVNDPMVDTADAARAWPERPLWMLSEPLRLAVSSGQPLCPGPLELCRGPERIENGWWDGRDIRRDYYVARNRRGRCLWVFRDLRSGQWYLHGVFG